METSAGLLNGIIHAGCMVVARSTAARMHAWEKNAREALEMSLRF